jgi:polyhydroxyalkanoate synthesis regulator phasin
MRIAHGDSVKVNAEVSKDVDQIIKEYQSTKAKRFDTKVSKNDACSDILEMGISEAVSKMKIWNHEIEDLETQIENFKNQK